MALTITADWWLAPLAVTIIAFGWSSFQCSKIERSGGGYAFDATPLVWLFLHGVAAFISLAAWFVWAVLT